MSHHPVSAAVAALAVCGWAHAAGPAGGLSQYRSFRFGASVSDVARLAGIGPDRARTIHQRPALLRELEWSPQSLGSRENAEAVRVVVFSFYEGALFRIEVEYDRYEIEGLTAADLIESVSRNYGVAVRPEVPARERIGRYGDEEEIVARWEDDRSRFDLIRSPFGPAYRLVGIFKPLAGQARSASLEAERLDALEAPQREAARLAGEAADAKVALEKQRSTNKPKFRP